MTAKPSSHQEPLSGGSNSPKKPERCRRCYQGASWCEQVLSTPLVRETVINEEEISLSHARRVCTSDVHLGTTQAVCTRRPASPEVTDVVSLPTSQLPREPLCLRNPVDAAALVPLNATRRTSPRATATDTAAASSNSVDPSKITMASAASCTGHNDGNTECSRHSRTSSLLHFSPRIHYDVNRESIETDAALQISRAAISPSLLCSHTSSLATPRALPSHLLSSRGTISIPLTKPRAGHLHSEGARSSSPTGACGGGAASIISDALALTPEKPDHSPLHTLPSEEGAYMPVLSTFITTQCTVPPITAAQAEKQDANTRGSSVPRVPRIRLPIAYTVSVSDSEPSLASIPALGYGPRNTLHHCSLTSARSTRSTRSARNSNRCTSTLRNGEASLKELFPTLPDELYLTRDRLCISQDSKRRLGTGAYAVVQQAELYPPGVDAPRIFTPTSESVMSTSIPSTPRFSPAKGHASIHSFSSIAAAVGSRENVVGVRNGGRCGAEQTGRPASVALTSKTTSNIHFRTVSTLSSDSVTTSALPLHQQPYNEQTASFYNGVDDMVRWSSAVESAKDLPWGHRLSFHDDPTLSINTMQTTVLSSTSASHATPVFDAVSTESSECQHIDSQSPPSERHLHHKTTVVTSMDFNCQTHNDLQLPAMPGLGLGHHPRLCVGWRKSLPASSGDLSSRDCGTVTAVDDADESTARADICEEGHDHLTRSIASVCPSKGEGETVDGGIDAGTQYSTTSSTGRGTFDLPQLPVEGGGTYRSSSTCIWHRVACEPGEASGGSGLRMCPSFTSRATHRDTIGTASTAVVEGQQTSCCEIVAPPVTVDADVHRFQLRTAHLVSSKPVDDIDASYHTTQNAAMVEADTSDKEQAEGYHCLPSVLSGSLEEGASNDVQPTTVLPVKAIHIDPSLSHTDECCDTELATAEEEEEDEGWEDAPAEKTSGVPESRGPKLPRQRLQGGLEMSGSSFLVSISYSERDLTCNGAGKEMLMAQQAAKGVIRETQEKQQCAVGQKSEETANIPGAGLPLVRQGHDRDPAGSEAPNETRSHGEAATTTSTGAVLPAAVGEVERIAQCFTHLGTDTPTMAPAAKTKGAHAGVFCPCTHVRGGAGANEILEEHVTLSSTSSSWTASGPTPTGDSTAASAMLATSTTKPGNIGDALASGSTTNTLQSSLEFLRTPVCNHDMDPLMVPDALSSSVVPFRAVASKAIEKMDLTCNAMKLNAFHNELRMASRLRHPCLVNIFGVAEDDEHFYLVMDLAEKGNLAQYQQRFGLKATREMAPQFTADVVLALEYLGDGSLHSYQVTPPSDITDDILPQDQKHCTSRALDMRGDVSVGSTVEPRVLPGSLSTNPPLQAPQTASAATVSKRLSLSAPIIPTLLSQHTSVTDLVDKVGADGRGSAFAMDLAPRELISEPSKSPLRTSPTDFGQELPVPAHAVTLPRQQGDHGKSLVQRDSIIVHRDLKPENLLLTWDYRVKLADFGDACFYGDDEANSFGGTPSYISPEVFARCKASPYSDLWALGCVLYELLVGERLFSGSLVDVGTAVQKFKPEALLFPDMLTSATAGSSVANETSAGERGSGAGAGISEAAKDLVRQLLQPIPEERLGSWERGGFDALKAHPFFADINWAKLLETTNRTAMNLNYRAQLDEYLEPTESVVYGSPVKLLRTLEGGRSKEHGSTKRGTMNSRSTQMVLVMVLTDAPRLLLVNLDLHAVQLEIPLSTELRVSVLRTECFTITAPIDDVLRSSSTSVSGSLLPPTVIAGTNPMPSSSDFSATTANTITYTFYDCSRRADLWGVKIHQLQSMCSMKRESGNAAVRSLPRLYSTPVVSMNGGAFHLPPSSASSQQLQHTKRRDNPAFSPRARKRFLQWTRRTPRTMRSGSLSSLTISGSERSIGVSRDTQITAATSTLAAPSSDARITPAARAHTHATTFPHGSFSSQSSVFTVSSATAVTPGSSSVRLHSSDLPQPPSFTGTALPSHRLSATMTVTIASLTTSDPLRGSLNAWNANAGNMESSSCPKLPLESDCMQSDACAQPASLPSLSSTTSTSDNTPDVSPSKADLPVGSEDLPQCGGNVSEARWNVYSLTSTTSMCASTGALHALSASAGPTCTSSSVPESALGCSSSAGAATPHLTLCSGIGCGGDGFLANSLEGAHEAVSQGEGTPGPWNTPKHVDSDTGTPNVSRLPSVCRSDEEEGALEGGASIAVLAETTSASAGAATNLSLKRLQARQQYRRAKKTRKP
ncbi:protein kinase, putative [Leishmania tarentolae]|uniref:non-specific serine/threonine protein kinase n=1 Tax=Leishmania tarentolae TaxID=5689 RepID=A0A640KNH6_LEITA|nr:protein kinase, putative [Leishmania tarentolae]